MIMAFSNPEYMTLSEINESLSKFKRDLTSTAISTPVCSGSMKRRPVPLPPPPSTAPLPPQLPPPLVNRTKLYQNIDHFSQNIIHHQKEVKSPIHVNCDFFSTPAKNSNKENINLLIATNNYNNSFSYLHSNINNSTTTSDSSSATMIIKKSPTYYKSSISSSGSFQDDLEDVLLCNKNNLKSEENSKLISSLLSPIMTSSRADLNSYNNLMSRVAIHLNNEIQEDVEEDEDEKLTTLINNKTPPPVFIYASSTRQNIKSKLTTNSLPCKRTREYRFDRLNITQQELIKHNNNKNNSIQQIETTLINNNNNVKSFNNYNYELVQLNENEDDTTTSPNLSSVDSLILLPPSPFKSTETPQSKSNIKAADSVSRSAKKVSFLLRESHHKRNIEQYYYDEVFEEQDQDEFLIEQDLHHLRQRRHSLSSGSSSSCSTNSSINTGSNSMLKSKIVFSNNHYFISSDKQQSDSSSSSSIPVSSASSCSSTSSSSSGYKSNQSASASRNNKYMSTFGPTELDQFIKISRGRLERLKLKRFQLISENNLIEQKDEFIQFDTLKRKENKTVSINTKPVTGSNYVDSVLFKNVSAKLFQKLLNNKSNSPCNTLPRCAKF